MGSHVFRSFRPWIWLPLVMALALTLASCDLFSGKHTYADLDFSQKGNAAPALTKGFSGLEPEGRWTEGTLAEITVRLDKIPEKNVSLVATLSPMAVPGHAQNVDISINGKLVGHWLLTIGQMSEQTALIPAGTITSSDPVHITFGLPNAATPESLKVNTDKRVLGVYFKRLQVVDSQ